MVVVRTERDLDGRDRGELERFVQLGAVDVRETDVPHEPFVCEPGQRTHRGAPRGPRIGNMDEVEVDREAVESGEARLAICADRLRAAVGDPAATGPRHAALGHDPRGDIGLRAPETMGEQPFVVPVRPRGVEDGDSRLGGGRDRRESLLLVTVLVRRHPHAAETDAELRGGEPAGVSQAGVLTALVAALVVARRSGHDLLRIAARDLGEKPLGRAAAERRRRPPAVRDQDVAAPNAILETGRRRHAFTLSRSARGAAKLGGPPT